MKIVNDKIINSTKFTDVHSTTYQDREGNNKEWTWVGRPNVTKAVMIVALVEGECYWKGNGFHYNNKLCIIKEFRVPVNNYLWEFPAGLIDTEIETVEDAVKRELKEETGLDVDYIYQISPFGYNSPGITDESIAMAFVRAKGELTTKNLEASEELEPYLMNQDEVVKLLETEKNFGAKAWLVMNHFAKTNHII